MPSLRYDSSLKRGLFLKSGFDPFLGDAPICGHGGGHGVCKDRGMSVKSFIKVTCLGGVHLFLLFQMTMMMVSEVEASDSRGIMVADLDDVESEMEDTLQESDAATEEAKASRNRAENERKAADKAKEEAQGAIARARSKSRDAEAQISEYDKKIVAARQEKEAYQKDIQRSEAQIKKLNQDIANKKNQHAEMIDARDKTLRDRNMINEKVSGNMNQIREIEYQIQKTKETVTKAKKDLAESKLAEKSSLARIRQTEEKLRKETRDAETKKSHFKEQMDASNSIVNKAELQMRKLRKELELKEEEVGMAEAEADQAKGRAADAQAHLNELKAGQRQRLAQLGTRKEKAHGQERKSASLESRARMSAVAVENANDAIAARQDNGMKVSTTRKEASSKKMSLSKDCNLRDAASANGRVVQAVHQGQELVVSQHNGVWMKVHIKGKKEAFVAKTCF
ncbi:MAG: hypothetical protein IPJ71_06525 [Bdellovibrionales bacterium]|nr:hypothetical protein [Bdellovibrionales bacterium]